MSSILDTAYLHPTHPAHSRLREQAAELTARIRHLSLVPPMEFEPTPQPPVRLTRRGRLAMFLSTVLMLIVLAVILGSTTVATDARMRSRATASAPFSSPSYSISNLPVIEGSAA